MTVNTSCSFSSLLTVAMEDLELTYEHIDWVDIVDAELSGDQEAIQKLMYVIPLAMVRL